MSSVPIALWNLKVPSGGAKVPGYDEDDGLPYRITMAAIDSATPSSKPSTLKLHKRTIVVASDSDEDQEEEIDDGESTEEDFVICTLEAGKVLHLCLSLIVDVSTGIGYYYA
jgi:Nucleoplasmin-like domain